MGLRRGHHEPLVSFATHERIRARLNGSGHAPARKDINKDFPHREIVVCDDCGEAMTSCWSNGRKKHYPYYLCDKPTCTSARKSIPRADIEGGAEALLRSLQPARQFYDLVRAMFVDAWNMRLTEARDERATLDIQIKDVEEQIDVEEQTDRSPARPDRRCEQPVSNTGLRVADRQAGAAEDQA